MNDVVANMADLKIRVLEIAERSVHQPYVGGGTNSSDPYRDKDMGEILRRSDRFLQYALDAASGSPDTTSGLIERLRGVLCKSD